jgi:hypothetical protein
MGIFCGQLNSNTTQAHGYDGKDYFCVSISGHGTCPWLNRNSIKSLFGAH